MIACRKSFTDTLLELARQDKDIVAVTTDARGSVTLGDFAKELPAQFVECGIAEQDAVGISAGLAHSGKKVFVCGPACFYVARSLEQVKVDLAYSQNNVKILGVSGGVAYGALGATHHSLHDIAVLRTFPGMNIVLPCDARQTRKLVKLLVDYPEPVYVRVGRAAVPDVYENDDFEFVLGKANTLLDGTDLTFQPEHQRSRVIGRLFQDPMRGTAPHMTIEENLALAYLRASHGSPFRRITPKDRELFRSQLAQLDMGLEERMRQPVGLLSGGQRQALTLLMATMVPPKLLLLDEHTAALDPATADKVLELTRRIVAEHRITCLMVTHNMAQALSLGSRTLMMAEGSIVLDVSGTEREGLTVNDLLERFRSGAGHALDNDRILLA